MSLAVSPPEGVVTVRENEFVDQVAASMHAEDVGSVVVVDETEKPTGVLTDRDLALALRERTDLEDVTAGDLMTEDPVTVEEGTSVVSVLDTMKSEGVRRVPVVDEAGDPVRVVSLDDALVLLGEELADVAELVEEQV
ncbi:MAG: CBS domain-containing protein [Halobacterium sp.]